MLGKQQALCIARALNGTHRKKGEMATWPFSGYWRVLDQTLFQVILVTVLLAPVTGDCDSPPYLSFASPINELHKTEYKTGESVRYTCRPGYGRASSKQYLTCTSRGLWEYDTFCIKKRCRNPGDLPNGQVEVKTDFSFGSQIEFSCSEGYFLIGSSSSYCDIQEKGVEWSDPLPKCEIVKCESPPNINNGKHNGENENFFTFGSIITYTCDPDFTLLGEASISCTIQNQTVGTWSSDPPTCKKIICPQPDVPNGKIISGFRPIYRYKDSVMFDCKDGFDLINSSLIQCEKDSSWNPSPPVCKPNSCIGLPNIPNAYLRTQNLKQEPVYSVGNTLSYWCRSGYKPATNEPLLVTCLEDFTWSPSAGCEEICCSPPQLENSEIVEHRKPHQRNNCTYFYGDRVFYSCPQKARSSVTCQADGRWQPPTPSCSFSCDIPPSIAHGNHRQVSTFITKEVEYECEEGYRLVGAKKLSCRDERWFPEAPQCRAVCPKPEIMNGKLSVVMARYTEMESVTVQCNSGYGVIGSSSITCSENRTWYPEVPKCEWVVPEGCEQVLAGQRLMQCLANPAEVKMALEVYKLSLEIEILKLQRDKARKSMEQSEL
ncbi:C4b-binding protein alpha chain [Ochotona princeps]|uniref:C4b-binding protein alpha chain n=1 Tax=Ochotona princeps TaxID=9978 RepID=UPI0027148492|nr:C4b-binding protein alpha chain [Ochotona princeps]XP_058525104.1 C4b-binding protein alpha chain [Ochotona princeps]XP_058525105.1 C4b-binding protein alpha chain [Ochotona princeps]XP_058525106.1 C4b-binding protein alpha chain [Ochotona princeps]